MSAFLKILPVVAVLAAGPALAATADQHAAHHAKGKAAAGAHKPKGAAGAAAMGCPMHDQMAQAGAKPGDHMPCMDHMAAMQHGAAAEAKPPADAAHDHDHASPK